MTDETGATIDRRAYEAFGVQVSELGADPLPYRFAGEPVDAVTRSAYHRARWMDPRLGRFLSVDPVDASQQAIGKYQPYGYGAGNPVTNVDPTGKVTMVDVMVSVAAAGITFANVRGTYRLWRGSAVQQPLTSEEFLRMSGEDLYSLALSWVPLVWTERSDALDAKARTYMYYYLDMFKSSHDPATSALGSLQMWRERSYENSQIPPRLRQSTTFMLLPPLGKVPGGLYGRSGRQACTTLLRRCGAASV